MSHIKIASKTQADVRIFDKIDDFFNRFNILTMLHRCGVRFTSLVHVFEDLYSTFTIYYQVVIAN